MHPYSVLGELKKNHPYESEQIQDVRKRLYPYFIFFLGAQCVESGVSCTDCY
jgi:hypothetical protein